VSTLSKSSAIAAAVAGMAMIVAGCGSSSSSGGGGTTTLSPAKSVAASSLKTQSTPIGSVLVASNGDTIYALVGDTTAHQTCDSSCQAFWPPVMSGGSQIVINGHPAFTFTNDTKPGQTLGEGAKDTWGLWLALDANGNTIAKGAVATGTTPSPSPSSTTTGAGGGYGY
jgi:predicted lipoprotein with Yx(FWY)xxD motif